MCHGVNNPNDKVKKYIKIGFLCYVVNDGYKNKR